MQPSHNSRRILVGEDELEVRAYLEMAVKCLGYSVELAQDGDEVLSCLQASGPPPDAVLLDLMMPNRDGLDTLKEIRRIHSSLPVIIVSGAFSTMNVVAAMKNGATDFLCKPVVHEDLQKAITRALDLRGGSNFPSVEKTIIPATRAFVGTNPRMREIQSLADQIGWSEAPVLVQGETGSGKEVIAREFHARSPRAKKLFLKLNCAALPSELVESELFGYERGAFTGAFQKKAGMFEMADGGTILLDEIGDMDVRLQAKLLQVLQDHQFQRIGGKDIVKVDVRIMAATHRDLEAAIADRTFREDLYYRLNVINIHIPPLRERSQDILAMAEYLMKRHATPGVPPPALSPELRRTMLTYGWPGNVRELENVVRKLLILGDADLIARELQGKTTRRALVAAAKAENVTRPAATDFAVSDSPILEQVTKAKHQAQTDAILAALNATRWNRKQAAALLKVDYKALLYKMKKLGVESSSTGSDAMGTAAPQKMTAGGQ
ncbi:MAG: sigma-54 dependent transcriptional regulator [Candidatus Solibacter sp.]